MKRPSPVLLVLLAGVLEALAFPLVVPQLSLRELDPGGHLEWIAWVGLVPALFALDAARTWKRAFGLGLLAGMVHFFVVIYWVNHAMTAYGGLPLWLSLVALTLLVLYMAAHWGAAFAISFAIRRRLGWPWAAHFPLVWAALELSRNYLFTGFPWGNLGYSQARHPAISQLAAALGIYAIAALVVLVNCAIHAVVAAALERRAPPVWLAAATALLVTAVVVLGEAHLARVRAHVAASPKLQVALVQANVPQDLKNASQSNARFILDRLVPLTLEADRAGADLVAWPEAAYPFYVPPQLAKLAERGGVPPLRRAHLLLGAGTLAWNRGADGKRHAEVTNSVFLLRPDLSVVGRYTKHHLVPFGEYVPLARFLPFLHQVVPDLAPASAGAQLTTLGFPLLSAADPAPSIPTRTAALGSPPHPDPLPGGEGIISPARGATRFAPMICFDAIFPEVNVAFADQDPEFLVNPTNDAWYGYSSGPYQFLAIVRLRAIEAGRAVARPAYSGVSALVLPTGEVAPGAIELGPVDGDRSPAPEEPAKLLMAELPRLRGRTLYTSIGDLFAYACALFTAVALGLAAWRPHRRS